MHTEEHASVAEGAEILIAAGQQQIVRQANDEYRSLQQHTVGVPDEPHRSRAAPIALLALLVLLLVVAAVLLWG